MHKSVRGIIQIDNGIVLIHRIKPQKDGTMREYYVIPGGKMEKDETEEDTVIREIYEELGISVKPERKILEYDSDYDNSIQIFYTCKYLNGVLGTGDGPEIINPRGVFEPVVIEKENIKNINLVPEEIKKILEKEEI